MRKIDFIENQRDKNTEDCAKTAVDNREITARDLNMVVFRKRDRKANECEESFRQVITRKKSCGTGRHSVG